MKTQESLRLYPSRKVQQYETNQEKNDQAHTLSKAEQVLIMDWTHIKCCTFGTLSSVTVRNVLYFAISSEHEASYAALATVLFTYAFSSLSIIFMIEYKFAKSSAATTKSHKKSPRRVVEEGQCGTVVGVRPQLQPHRTAVAHFCYTKACWRLPLDDPRHMYDACSVRLGRLPHSN